MPLGSFEKKVLRFIAANRNPESYIAGASVLNQAPETLRYSRDIDLFHDSSDAVQKSFQIDSEKLSANGFKIQIEKFLPGFIRALVSQKKQSTLIDWAVDSTFRFFPIEKDLDFGYKLNFWDASTNKVLAAISRVEIRDYVDLIELHKHHLSLGALIWAAAGKDAGLSPQFILSELQRTQRYTKGSFEALFLAKKIDPEDFKKIWIQAISNATELFEKTLFDAPPGIFFLNSSTQPEAPTTKTLSKLARHQGSLKGTWPRSAK